MKILVTGAHFTTAVAVIKELKKNPQNKLIYVGRNNTREGDNTVSAESQIIPSLGVKFIPIITGRLQKSFTIYTIPSLLKIPIGFLQSLYIVLKQQPDIILSFGGYVAVPIVVISWLFSIPIIIHEQTLVSGLANKICSLFADKIATSFSDNKQFDTTKIILTGNPIREEVLNPDTKNLTDQYKKIFNNSQKENMPVILITGGNQGSHVINLKVEECLNDLTKIAFIIHQTGDSKFHDFERLKLKENNHYIAEKFIDKEMGAILSKIDLVVSRAGINILTELAYLGKPTLVIPVPYLYQDEQNKNAKYFEKLGLVKILPQSKLTSQSLLKDLKEMIRNLSSLTALAKNAKSVVIPDSAKRLSLEVSLLLNKENYAKD